MEKGLQSTEKSILSRIRGHGRGWVFTPRHFLDLASRPAITSALRRQTEAGTIRQLGRGLYDYPKLHPRLGQLSPTPEALAAAMAGRDRVRLQPSGAYAANLLGLSEQVPAKVVFLTDGPSRVVQIGPMTYADTAALVLHADASGAVVKPELCERVVRWKSRFFGSAWARYDLAVPPTFRLVPPPEREAVLRRDYQAMRDMYLSEPTPFEEILGTLANVERRVNEN